jgi:hypothetical protein
VFSAIVANAIVCRFVEALFPARSAQFHVRLRLVGFVDNAYEESLRLPFDFIRRCNGVRPRHRHFPQYADNLG